MTDILAKSSEQDSAEMLAEMLEMRQRLDEQIIKMQKIIRKQRYPKAPPVSAGNMFGVNVKFNPNGKMYKFLILRTPGGWYTTGTTPDTLRFDSWAALIDWLRGPDVHWHGALFQLNETEATFLGQERNR